MRLRTCALLLSLLAAGCITSDGDPAGDVEREGPGLAEIRIDGRSLLDASITQVTLEGGGQSATLVLNPATGTYDGTLILAAGPQTLVARAFSGTTVVGASNPAAVTIQSNQVTRVVMRILDVTGSPPPVYGPILDSLVYPATAQATVPVSLTASVVAPVGDPVTYQWSSSCPDSTFSAPTAAATSWSKAAQGACTLTMVATSNGFGISQSFEIVVFPAGSLDGAVDASALLVTAPTLFLGLPEAGCFVSRGGNASCAGSLTSPSATAYEVSVMSWGGSTPGALTLSDNCGGKLGTSSTNPEYRTGHWLPPVNAGVCILTASATNGDGLVSTLSAAILVRAGTPPTAQPPIIFGQMFPGNNCGFTSDSPTPTDCGTVPPGTQAGLYGNISWANGHPESVVLLDDCNGGLIQPTNAFNFNSAWSLPGTPGQTCTLTIRATNLQGNISEASALYHLQ